MVSSLQSYYKETVFTPALIFFYKQRISKQLALRWQIAKQLSGPNPLFLSDNKNYRLKESGVFLCNKRKIGVKPTVHLNSAVSKALLGKFSNH